MERTLLYYPTIDIPDMKWLYSSILYADKISSIVPYETSDERFPDLLKFLIDQNQYKPILIGKLLNRPTNDFNEFESFFINTTSSPELNPTLRNKKHLQTKTMILFIRER